MIRSINGQLLAASKDEAPLQRALELLGGISDGVDIKMELESDMLMSVRCSRHAHGGRSARS